MDIAAREKKLLGAAAQAKCLIIIIIYFQRPFGLIITVYIHFHKYVCMYVFIDSQSFICCCVCVCLILQIIYASTYMYAKSNIRTTMMMMMPLLRYYFRFCKHCLLALSSHAIKILLLLFSILFHILFSAMEIDSDGIVMSLYFTSHQHKTVDIYIRFRIYRTGRCVNNVRLVRCH